MATATSGTRQTQAPRRISTADTRLLPYDPATNPYRDFVSSTAALSNYRYNVKLILPSYDLVFECVIEPSAHILSIYPELRRIAVSNEPMLSHLTFEQKRQLLGSAISLYVVTPSSSSCLPVESTFGRIFHNQTDIDLYFLTHEEMLQWPKKRPHVQSPARQRLSGPKISSYSPAFLAQNSYRAPVPVSRPSSPSPSSVQDAPPAEPSTIPVILSEENPSSQSSYDIQMSPIQVQPTAPDSMSDTEPIQLRHQLPASKTTNEIQLMTIGSTVTKKEAHQLKEIQRLNKALKEEKTITAQLQEKVEVLERQRGEIDAMLIDLRMTTEALKTTPASSAPPPAPIPMAPPVLKASESEVSSDAKPVSTAPRPSSPPKKSIFARRRTSKNAKQETQEPQPDTSSPPPSNSGTKSLADMLKEKAASKPKTDFQDPLESKPPVTEEPQESSGGGSFLEELQKRQASKKQATFIDPELAMQKQKEQRTETSGPTEGRSIVDEIRERNAKKERDGPSAFVDPVEARKAEKAKALQEAMDLRSGLRKTGKTLETSNAPAPSAPDAALFASPVFKKRQAALAKAEEPTAPAPPKAQVPVDKVEPAPNAEPAQQAKKRQSILHAPSSDTLGQSALFKKLQHARSDDPKSMTMSSVLEAPAEPKGASDRVPSPNDGKRAEIANLARNNLAAAMASIEKSNTATEPGHSYLDFDDDTPTKLPPNVPIPSKMEEIAVSQIIEEAPTPPNSAPSSPVASKGPDSPENRTIDTPTRQTRLEHEESE